MKLGITASELKQFQTDNTNKERIRSQQHLDENMKKWLPYVRKHLDICMNSEERRVNIPITEFVTVSTNKLFGLDESNALINAINGSGEGFTARRSSCHPDCDVICSNRCAEPTILITW